MSTTQLSLAAVMLAAVTAGLYHLSDHMFVVVALAAVLVAVDLWLTLSSDGDDLAEPHGPAER